MQVDAESLQIRIDNLEMLKRHEIISLNGEYQLEAYKMLLARLECEAAMDFLYGAEDLVNG